MRSKRLRVSAARRRSGAARRAARLPQAWFRSGFQIRVDQLAQLVSANGLPRWLGNTSPLRLPEWSCQASRSSRKAPDNGVVRGGRPVFWPATISPLTFSARTAASARARGATPRQEPPAGAGPRRRGRKQAQHLRSVGHAATDSARATSTAGGGKQTTARFRRPDGFFTKRTGFFGTRSRWSA
jgi:hypothetical protein